MAFVHFHLASGQGPPKSHEKLKFEATVLVHTNTTGTASLHSITASSAREFRSSLLPKNTIPPQISTQERSKVAKRTTLTVQKREPSGVSFSNLL